MRHILIWGIAFFAACPLLVMAQDFTVTDLRKTEIPFFDIEGEAVDVLNRASLSPHFGDIAVIGYDPEFMMAQLVIPGRAGEDIFVLTSDIRVAPEKQWRQLTMASVDMETVCLAERPSKPLPGTDESTHAAHALFSCR